LSILRYIRRLRLRFALSAYRRSPSEGATARLVRALVGAGHPREALEVATLGRKKYEGLQAVYEQAKTAQARSLLSAALGALDADPSAENHVKVAELCRTAGDLSAAFRHAEEARTRYPSSGAVLFCLGKLHYQRLLAERSSSDQQAALEHLMEARKLNPGDYSVLLVLALASLRAGNLRVASSALSELKERYPDDERARQLAGHLNAVLQGSPAEGQASTRAGRTRAGTAASAHPVLKEILSSVPGALGCFLFDAGGAFVDSTSRANDLFAFGEGLDSVYAFVDACRFDSERIGLGKLRSYVVSGESWRVAVHQGSDLSVVTFTDATVHEDDLEQAVCHALEGSLVT
jgi:tetratricopeptide (TPR) repeat protein